MKSYSTAPPAPEALAELLKREVAVMRKHKHQKLVRYLGLGECRRTG